MKGDLDVCFTEIGYKGGCGVEKFLFDVPDPVCVLLDDDLLALQPIYVYLHIFWVVFAHTPP